MDYEIESIIDEFFALTHLIECQSPLRDTRLFGVPKEVMFMVEPNGYDGEFRVIQEMPISSVYTGEVFAEGRCYYNGILHKELEK